MPQRSTNGSERVTTVSQAVPIGCRRGMSARKRARTAGQRLHRSVVPDGRCAVVAMQECSEAMAELAPLGLCKRSPQVLRSLLAAPSGCVCRDGEHEVVYLPGVADVFF